MKDFLRQLVAQYQVARIRAAHNKYCRLLAITPRYWKAASIGGGVNLDLGRVTQTEAIERIKNDGLAVAHIDLEAAFIMVRAPETNHPD